jgi:hypothetical protein
MQFDVFISHSSHDKSFADATCAALERAGIRCWIAPRDILPGADWGEAILNALDTCRAMVLIFSSNADSSPQIRREVERVVSRGIPVIPVRIEDKIPTKALAYFMGSVHWLDAITPPIERHLQRLADSLKAVLAVENPRPTDATQPANAGAATAIPKSAPEVAAPGAQVANAINPTTSTVVPATSRARLIAMKAALWVSIAIGALLTVATIVYKIFGWLPVTAALTFISYWLVLRNLVSQIPTARVAALGCGLVWAYLAIWNAATPDIPLVVIEGIAAGCLLYVAVELARLK